MAFFKQYLSSIHLSMEDRCLDWSLPLSCCLRFSMMPGVSTKVTLSSNLWGISMPTSRSRKPWPNFSSGEKDLELSAAITMPSMVRNLSPCMMTVYSDVVGSAPGAGMKRKGFSSGACTKIRKCQVLFVLTCVKFLGCAMETQKVVDHRGLSNTPGSEKQNHWLWGDLTICRWVFIKRRRKVWEKKKKPPQILNPALSLIRYMMQSKRRSCLLINRYLFWNMPKPPARNFH